MNKTIKVKENEDGKVNFFNANFDAGFFRDEIAAASASGSE